MSGERFFDELGAELERAARATLDADATEPAGRSGRARSSLAAGRRAAARGGSAGATLAVAVGAFLLIGGVRHPSSPSRLPRR